ncbi:MAG TPA: c-type cytochrome, partial [Thermoanaerobaculia bacterium]|nr:c-type cytochrome [Thermoanaerobaculia bacterium]
ISLVPGSVADIYLSTADVTHGVDIIGTNFNLMAVPGAVNYARVKFEHPGDYLVVCNEYCGLNHQNMAGVIHVTEKAAAPPPPPAAPAAGAGKALLEQYACTACHSVDGSAGTGPTFKGLFGSKRVFADGTTTIADEEYIERSIEKPSANVVKGFDNVMPEMPVPPADIHAIVQYIETLK